jgi:hypothetical protein
MLSLLREGDPSHGRRFLRRAKESSILILPYRNWTDGPSKPSETAPESEPTFALQTPQDNSDPHAAPNFLSKLQMPLLICNSSGDLFSTLHRSQPAVSFTFCPRLFVQSVLANPHRKASRKDNKPYWYGVVVHLNGYQSFFAEVEALAVSIEEQRHDAAGEFHVLFVDGGLLELLATDESRRWPDAVKGYVLCTAGKVVQIIYGIRFSVDCLRRLF